MYIQDKRRAGRGSLPAQAVKHYNNSDISSAAKVNDDIRSIESCRRQFICQHYGRSIERSFYFHISVVIIVRRLVTATVVFDFESDTEENSPKEQDGKYNTSTA